MDADRITEPTGTVEDDAFTRDAFSDEELDALASLAEFEIEHRRILAMQTIYYRRRKYGTA